jgi:hypothetical protein
VEFAQREGAPAGHGAVFSVGNEGRNVPLEISSNEKQSSKRINSNPVSIFQVIPPYALAFCDQSTSLQRG